jgi:beta-glucanase (GH16 family)
MSMAWGKPQTCPASKGPGANLFAMTDFLALSGDRRLMWSDDFDGPAGSAPDLSKWGHEVGGNGWGNNELQYYTDELANACLTGDGNLAITAHKLAPGNLAQYDGCQYTSARLITKGLAGFTYGLVEVRLQLPPGGLWPGFWMLGGDIDEIGWPACGEIDVMENFGDDLAVVHGTVHGPGYSEPGITVSHDTGTSLAERHHVFAVSWGPQQIRWHVDGYVYGALTARDLGARPWVFDHEFYLLLNLAVGGGPSAAPGPSVLFPQVMLIDYVRVYGSVPA